MSITQEALDELRAGEFDKIKTLCESVINKYSSIYGKTISQDVLQPLLSYELVTTDIKKEDITDLLKLQNVMVYRKNEIDPSGIINANLGFLVSAAWIAISIQNVSNYNNSIPQALTSENIDDFLNDNSVFSKLQSDEKYLNYMDGFNDFLKQYDKCEEESTKKIETLKPICNQYIQHLTTIIEKHIKEKNIKLHNRIFRGEEIKNVLDANNPNERKDIIIEGGVHRLDEVFGGIECPEPELQDLINSDSNFKLAVNKYRAVSGMLSKLEDEDQCSQGKLESFKTTFYENKNLLHTRRDGAGMTFLKAVATVLSLGSVLLFKNFWKPESKKKYQDIESVLTAKM